MELGMSLCKGETLLELTIHKLHLHGLLQVDSFHPGCTLQHSAVRQL